MSAWTLLACASILCGGAWQEPTASDRDDERGSCSWAAGAEHLMCTRLIDGDRLVQEAETLVEQNDLEDAIERLKQAAGKYMRILETHGGSSVFKDKDVLLRYASALLHVREMVTHKELEEVNDYLREGHRLFKQIVARVSTLAESEGAREAEERIVDRRLETLEALGLKQWDRARIERQRGHIAMAQGLFEIVELHFREARELRPRAAERFMALELEARLEGLALRGEKCRRYAQALAYSRELRRTYPQQWSPSAEDVAGRLKAAFDLCRLKHVVPAVSASLGVLGVSSGIVALGLYLDYKGTCGIELGIGNIEPTCRNGEYGEKLTNINASIALLPLGVVLTSAGIATAAVGTVAIRRARRDSVRVGLSPLLSRTARGLSLRLDF